MTAAQPHEVTLSSAGVTPDRHRLDLPPGDAHTSSHRVSVRTSELATTGLVSECWVT